MALKDITLGQYFPGKTIIHRLDPRTKLIGTVAYIVALFLAANVVTYAILLVLLAALIAISKVGVKSILRGMRPIFIIILITAILNLFFTPGKGEPLVSWWVFTIYVEGIRAAVFMILRIMMLITCTFLLTYTTSPIMLTDGLEKLLSPLKAIRVPIHELAMMMSIALRFIPTLIEETDKIMSAQKARGADFDRGSLIRKAKALGRFRYRQSDPEGQGPGTPAGAPVHLCLPPGRRAGGGYGMPLLPRRQRAHPPAAAENEGDGYRRPAAFPGSVCGDRCAGSLRLVRDRSTFTQI